MRKLIFTFFISLSCVLVMAQTTVSGVIVDASSNEPLIGANVMNTGTLDGTITDVDGTFTLNVPGNSGDLEVSFVGYKTMVISFESSGGSYDLGSIAAEQSTVGLEEVVITGTMDIVQDRRTPVAVSTIGAAEIQAKGGNVEFPDLMKNTPSIYVAGQAGGYGDSEVFTRGFDQTNTAFLLNGQPINGMEDGKMYWSNWSGMSDVASAVQVQRGLGSSKLAISSVGGTTNIIMKSTEQQRGGSLSYLLGNDGYNKVTASYNTGMVDGKFGLTVLLTHWQGNGWAEGTKGQGQNYFISAGWKTGKSDFNFLITGAPQWHDQNFGGRISDHFEENGELNVKHNGNWGTLNGEHFTSRRNYYHKPVANLNWELELNDNSSLSTVLYGSWGRGGGSGGIGNSGNRKFTADGQWDFDAIVAANQASHASGGDGNEYVLRNSVNNHSWYGVVSNYETTLSDQLTWSLGADLRSYRGSHFREVRDLLGASSYSQRANARFEDREITAEFSANPWSGLSNFADKEDRINYNNDETIRYAGVFTQLEYAKNGFSGYVQGALSNQNHVRFELFNETETNERSEKVSNAGYNIKGGFSIETGRNSNVFFNTGFYQRQPFHDNIYLNFSNDVNPVTVPEKVFGIEAGYKYQSRDFAFNINAYRTSWKDRASTNTLREGDVIPNGVVVGTEDVFQNAIQDQLHTGIEIDGSYDISSRFRLKGFASFGNWEYNGDIRSQYFDDQRELIYENTGEVIDGRKVGGSAQTSFGLGADYKISNAFRIDLDYLRFSNLYARVNADRGELKLPAYGVMDLGVSYRINMDGGNLLSLRANIYNLLGTTYISRATSATAASNDESENWNGINQSNFVTFGTTRTWNVSARYNFGIGGKNVASSGASNAMTSSKKMDSDGDGIKDHKDACPDIAGTRKFKGCPMSAEDMAAKAAAEAKAAEAARMQAQKEARMKAEADAKAAAERAAKAEADRKAAAEKARMEAEVAAKAAEEAKMKAAAAAKARDMEIRNSFNAALTGIQFNSARSTFKDESYAIMDQAVAVMNKYGDVRVLIQGHTDSQGKAENNKALSQKRADAVKEYIASKGIAASRLSTNGLGEEYPIADNNSATGRAQNRRVEFIVIK